MRNKLLSVIKPLLKPLFVLGLIVTLALGHADGALAARGSGGRIGVALLERLAVVTPLLAVLMLLPVVGMAMAIPAVALAVGLAFPLSFPS